MTVVSHIWGINLFMLIISISLQLISIGYSICMLASNIFIMLRIDSFSGDLSLTLQVFSVVICLLSVNNLVDSLPFTCHILPPYKFTGITYIL